MSAYIEPIKIALLVFPFLALAISTIFFVRQYRRYGRFIWSRGIILYSFVFYLLCAYFLVILPLPAISEVAQMTGPKIEWHLGASWVHFMQQTVLDIHDPGTCLPALKQGVVLEPLFNLLLTVPFGIYLRYYFNYSFKKTLLLSFCLTLFFELTQLTGLYFIYPRPYRLFDVNDLFVNTLGGVLGWVIAPIFTFLLPSREEIDAESYAKDTLVTVTRRFFAWAIDWVILNVSQTFLLLIVTLVSQKNMRDFTGDYWFFAVEVCLYFMLIPYLTNGQTLGKKNGAYPIDARRTAKNQFFCIVPSVWLILSDLCQYQSSQPAVRTFPSIRLSSFADSEFADGLAVWLAAIRLLPQFDLGGHQKRAVLLL